MISPCPKSIEKTILEYIIQFQLHFYPNVFLTLVITYSLLYHDDFETVLI